MSIYLRTSLKAGPFRFNLSPSGIGVSVGVPGFRVGSGPRGNYVRIGGRGVHYAAARQPARRPPAMVHQAGHGLTEAPPPGSSPAAAVAMQDLSGAPVQQLVAVHPSELVAQIAAAQRRVALWPYAACLIGLVALLTMPFGLGLLLIGAPAVVWIYLRDAARRAVVTFYQVDDQPAVRFGALTAAHAYAAQSHGRWHVAAQGSLVTSYQRKVNAGAGSLIQRSPAGLTVAGPPVLVTNIAVPTLSSGSRAVHFLPDRVLIRDGSRYAELPYPILQVRAQQQRFIEDGPVPGDSRMIGTTWQYANVKGGPDRRYKDNRQLPIMLYSRLTLSSPSGLLMVCDFSRPDTAGVLAGALAAMR